MKHVRIISPSGVINPEYIHETKRRLMSWGLHVSIGKYAFAQHGRFAGTEEQRLYDINEAFADVSVDIILCSRGGYGLQQIIDKVVLPNRPKAEWPLVVGFSDITELHALMSLHGASSLHASMCKAIAILPEDNPAIIQLKEILLAEQYHQIDVGLSVIQAPVIGGNLSVLYGLQGTSFSLNSIIDVCAVPPILLIEDISERHYHIDRMLHNLRMSGVFDRISGVIVGQFTECAEDPMMGCTLQETIKKIFGQYDYPIVFNAPYGHIDDNQALFLSLY